MSEIIVNLHESDQIPDELLGFAVIVARHGDKWLFCRHQDRDTYEIPGGHREPGEDIDYTAKRELSEETGAVDFTCEPVSVYSVTRGNKTTYGKVYFASVNEIGILSPESEIAEVYHFDTLPDEMTYPVIQPLLYEKVQIWLNQQSAKDELWDVYDSQRKLTGRTHRRADPLPPGDYHLVVHVWLQNEKGEFLITKRAPNKGYPNMWECSGGAAVTGDDSMTAAIREVKEETGLDIKRENGILVFTIKRDNYFGDVWLFKQDYDIGDVVLRENETIDAMYTSADEIRRMINSGEFIVFHNIDELFEKAQSLL